MKGWVYIITNKAMPDLVKVGFSTKDPIDRAKELSTGSPHPYIVEYEICVENPQKIEKSSHKNLSSLNEGKEWFRCNIETAINAIRSSCTNKDIVVERIINEEYKAKFINISSNTSKKVNKNKKLPSTQLQMNLEKLNNLDVSKLAITDLIELSKTNVDAKYELGVRYDTGNGVRKSLKEGFKYFSLAAEEGHTLAELAAGKAYCIGRGIEKDIYQALIFFKKAADKDNSEAQCLFGKHVNFIDMEKDEKYKKLKKAWCPNQSSDDFAISYIRKACVKNYPPAQYELASYFLLLNKRKQAFDLYEISAKNGYTVAQRQLAYCYLTGMSCNKNITLAKEWYQKAADSQDKEAKKVLEDWVFWIAD